MLNQKELLKIELMTRGMTVSDSARKAIEGDEKRPLTLADYASTSGISMELEDRIWVNAPIIDFNPNFVNGTPYSLDFQNGVFLVRSPKIGVNAKPIPVPDYHNKKNPSGEEHTRFGITHTDRVRISPIEGCANACTFCDLTYKFDYKKKSAKDLVESIKVALKDPIQSAEHIMSSGGTPRPEDYDYLNEVYGSVAYEFPNDDFDVMMVPMPGLLDVKKLKSIGVHGLSINLELYNQEKASIIMPGKHKASRQKYLEFIEKAVPIFGEGNVRSLLMVGLESIEDTLKGVQALAERGCDPVLSPFRPDVSTPMKDEMPPTVEYLREVYERSREIVDKYSEVKLGPRCIPCHHNTLSFPDNSGKYYFSKKRKLEPEKQKVYNPLIISSSGKFETMF